MRLDEFSGRSRLYHPGEEQLLAFSFFARGGSITGGR
jgi:hypothetical protein